LIDKENNLRCDGCGKVLGRNLNGRVEIVCNRSTCKRYNVFDTDRLPKQYFSHKVLDLTSIK